MELHGMARLLDYPFLILALSFAIFWIASIIGARLHGRLWKAGTVSDEEFKFVLGGALTLLGLIVGFTFSMAVNRYDQRKNYEEEEANAIGTAYVRADLLPTADAEKVRGLLRSYLGQRILKYSTRFRDQEISSETARLQTQLWNAVSGPATAQPTPVNALVLAGMNDVLNSQGYAQAARWNRIPVPAWLLLTFIAVFCNVLIGYGAQGKSKFLLVILPVVLAISFSFIADIDSPRGGFIRVHPQNLENLEQSLHTQ
jgi:hypothetical protein